MDGSTSKRRSEKGDASAGGSGRKTIHASVAQMRALAHPLRLRVLELFAEMPRTTMQVAELLGEPPTRLYHHVNALERAGLLRLRETRPNRGTIEKWYEAAAQRLQSAAPTRGTRKRPAQREATGLALMVLEQARRELSAALARPDGDRPLGVRLVAVGSRAQIATVRRRLLELVAQLQSDCPDAGEASESSAQERWSVTIALAPAWPRNAERGPRQRSRRLLKNAKRSPTLPLTDRSDSER